MIILIFFKVYKYDKFSLIYVYVLFDIKKKKNII